MIDNNIYLVSNKYINYYRIYNDDNVNEEEVKPIYKDTALNNEYNKIGFENISYFPESEDTSYMLIAGFNIENQNQANIETYLGAGSTIYCSKENLYIVHTKYIYEESVIDKAKEFIGIPVSYTVTSEIYKFNLDNSNIKFMAKGDVRGSVLNQFSMDESNRIF